MSGVICCGYVDQFLVVPRRQPCHSNLRKHNKQNGTSHSGAAAIIVKKNDAAEGSCFADSVVCSTPFRARVVSILIDHPC